MNKILYTLCLICIIQISLKAQNAFGPQNTISANDLNGATSLFAIDLDNDGDIDVLTSSGSDDKIAWYENKGNGEFYSQKVISTLADGAWSVYAIDLDGDGDIDVLSASLLDNKIAWYENLGANGFSPQKVISTATDFPESVYAADLDGDGDVDVLSASSRDDKIAWYENLGANGFASQEVISTTADLARSVYATDLDGDGDADVLSASFNDDKIAWYENLGANGFASEKVITTSADGAQSVYATDLDGDGDTDVISASRLDGKIAWYENTGAGNFSSEKVITTSADGAWSVFAADLDGDGDADVLSASSIDNKIAWYENLGPNGFSSQNVVSSAADGAWSVYAADLDGDGDADVLSASNNDNKVAWYENFFNQAPVANAGSDAIFVDMNRDGSATVSFDGSSSTDSDGNISSYIWFRNSEQQATGETADEVLPWGIHDIVLTITDSFGATDSDTVQITVHGLPLANAGPDNTVVASNGEEQANVNLDGSASTDDQLAGTDPVTEISSYDWSWDGGIATGMQPTVSLPIGTTTITLTVTDDLGAQHSDDVVITVESPVVPALQAATLTVAAGDTLTLSGSDLGNDATQVSAQINDLVAEVLSVSNNSLKLVLPETLTEGGPFLFSVSINGVTATGSVEVSIVPVEKARVSSILESNIRAGDEITVMGANLGSDVDLLSLELKQDGSLIAEAAVVSSVNAEGSELQVSLLATLAAGSYELSVLKENELIGTLTLIIIDPTTTDTTAPLLSLQEVPGHDKSGSLMLTATATDDVGITDFILRYAGLSEDFANARQVNLVQDGNSYSAQIDAPELDDPLGIRYLFYFEDAAGNSAEESGQTYWEYAETAFEVSASGIGRWVELPENADPTNTDRYTNIIAFPFRTQTVGSVLDELGETDKSEWRLFDFSTASQSFPEFSTSSRFNPGQGYFLIMKEDTDRIISFGGELAPLDYDDSEGNPIAYSLTLQSGWNLIGNPFPFALDWDKVVDDELNLEIVDGLSQLNRLTGEDTYSQSRSLDAFEGAFVNWGGSSTVTLYLTLASQIDNNQRLQSQSAKGWELSLTLEKENFYSSRAGVGMRPSAKEGRDYWDALSVPKLQPQPELIILGKEDKENINRSVVPEQGSYRWDLQLRGMQEGAVISMTWDRKLLGQFPEQLYLWDRKQQRLIDMAQQNSYTLQANSADQEASYQLYYGSKEDINGMLDIRQLSAGLPYPNPVTDNFALPLSLPQHIKSTSANLLIYNNQGQQVATYQFEALKPGYQELEILLPEGMGSGLYYYQGSFGNHELVRFKGMFIYR